MKLKLIFVICLVPFLLDLSTCTFEKQVESYQIPTYESLVTQLSTMDESSPEKENLEIAIKHVEDFRKFSETSSTEYMLQDVKFSSSEDLDGNQPIELFAFVDRFDDNQGAKEIKSLILINRWKMTVDPGLNYFRKFYGAFDVTSFFPEEEKIGLKMILLMNEVFDFNLSELSREIVSRNQPDPESINGIKMFINLSMGLRLFHKKFFMCNFNFRNILFKDVTDLKLKDDKNRYIIDLNNKKYTVKLGNFDDAQPLTEPNCNKLNTTFLPIEESAMSQRNICDFTALIVMVLDFEFSMAGVPDLFSSIRRYLILLRSGVKEDNQANIDKAYKTLSDYKILQMATLYWRQDMLLERFESIGGMQNLNVLDNLIDVIKSNVDHVDAIMMHIFLVYLQHTFNMKDLPSGSKLELKSNWIQMLFELLITNFEGKTNLKELTRISIEIKGQIKKSKVGMKRNLKLSKNENGDSTEGIKQSKEASMGEDKPMDRLSEKTKNSDLTPSQNEPKIIKNRLVIV
jgi:hypothetical protein